MIRISSPRSVSTLLVGASALAMAMPAFGQEVVFADNADLAAAALRGERVTQAAGVTQLRLASGAVLSFVEGAEFQLRPDGSVDLFKGSLTVTGAGKTDTLVHLGGEGTGKISGEGSSGSFSVGTDDKGRTQATGRVLTGLASIANGREEKRFSAGQAWEVANGHPRLTTKAPVAAAPRLSPTKAAAVADRQVATAAPTPPAIASVAEGGPAAAAENGVPVVLGEALAAAGASGDIVSAGQRIEAAVSNPTIETFPSDDLARLVAHAAQLERLYGGQPFNQAQADVIRAYLRYLAGGGSQAQFLTVYAGLMVQFLDLVRSGAAPTSFSGATFADINAFITYRGRTSGFTTLSSQNRVLVEAYVAFILGGGNADQFVARYTSLTSAYFTFLRGGGDPLAFQGATQATLVAYINFLNDSGLLVRLGEADRSLLQAYLANSGAAFIQQYRTALTAYFSYLSSGQLPSAYTSVDPAVLRQYLETLAATGLFEQVLGAQAQFYASYLAYLRTGGSVDGWQGLPVNIYTSYATALTSYRAYLAAGGVPSAYTALAPAVLQQYLDALSAAGVFERFLGGDATFYAQYLTYLRAGGSLDGWQGLPFNVFTGYAQALSAYYEYLANGGLPSAYTALTQDQIRVYLATLQAVGANEAFLGQLSAFYGAYFTFLANGGNPDLYTGLPTPPDYDALASALSAYVTYLQAGGVPSAYTGADLALLQQYIKALIDSGRLDALLGAQAQFLTAYYAFITGGGSADGYTGLPVYATYVTALEAYYAYLAGGGVPSAYTALTQEQILVYLRALTDAGVLAGLFSDATLAFIQSYYVYVAGGGNPDQFSGLPGGSGGTQTATGFIFNAEASQSASPMQADVSADGTISRLRFTSGSNALDFNYASNSANVLKEHGKFGDDVAWTRYLSDTANNAINFSNHLLVGTPSPTIPASGKIDYLLVGGTAPTDYFATEGTTGSFTGSLAVAFGSTPAVGISMDVESGSRGWHVQTPGGSANPSNGGLTIDANRRFSGGAARLQTTGTAGTACGGSCYTTVLGNLFGADAAYAGFGYKIVDTTSPLANTVDGVAVFGRSGTAISYLGNAPSGAGGGGTGGVLTSYTGGFNSTTPRISFITTLRLSGGTLLAGSEQGFDALAYSLNSSGGLTTYTRAGNITRTPGTMTVSDVAGDADVVLGRWNNGTNTGANTFTLTANQGFHYMLARQLPAGFAPPTTGIVQYDLYAATKPTWIDGSGAPGSFTGSFKVNFGLVVPRVGVEAQIVMPSGGAGGGAYTFDFATPGGLADISQSTSTFNIYSNSTFGFVAPGDDHSGSCNANVCYLAVNGTWAGSADKVGVTYTAVSDVGSAKNIIGSAAFAAGGNTSGGLSSAPGTASATLTGAPTLTMADGGTNAFAAQEVDVSADGAITRVKFNANSTTIYGSPGVLKEHGRVGDAVAWSRWDGASANANLNPNSHIVTGTPATALPVSGKVAYTLTGATAPTNYNGADGLSGTVSGTLAVQFGTQAKVGFNIDVATGPRGWALSTAGGSADPSNGGLVVGSDMRFGSGSVGIAAANANSCLGSCNASVVGALYGAGASHVGLGYQISDLSSNSIYTVNGAIVFGQVAP